MPEESSANPDRLSLAQIDRAMVELYPGYDHKPVLMRAYSAAGLHVDGFIARCEFGRLLLYVVHFNNAWHQYAELDVDGDRPLDAVEFAKAASAMGVGRGLSVLELQLQFRGLCEESVGAAKRRGVPAAEFPTSVLFSQFCIWCAQMKVSLELEEEEPLGSAEQSKQEREPLEQDQVAVGEADAEAGAAAAAAAQQRGGKRRLDISSVSHTPSSSRPTHRPRSKQYGSPAEMHALGRATAAAKAQVTRRVPLLAVAAKVTPDSPSMYPTNTATAPLFASAREELQMTEAVQKAEAKVAAMEREHRKLAKQLNRSGQISQRLLAEVRRATSPPSCSVGRPDAPRGTKRGDGSQHCAVLPA